MRFWWRRLLSHRSGFVGGSSSAETPQRCQGERSALYSLFALVGGVEMNPQVAVAVFPRRKFPPLQACHFFNQFEGNPEKTRLTQPRPNAARKDRAFRRCRRGHI